jgi:hypothetical protein
MEAKETYNFRFNWFLYQRFKLLDYKESLEGDGCSVKIRNNLGKRYLYIIRDVSPVFA